MGTQMLLQNAELVRNIMQDGRHIYKENKSGRHKINLWRPLYDYVNIILALALTMSLGMELFLTMLLPIPMDMPFVMSAIEFTPILNFAYGNNCQGIR